ncbi:DEAD-box ATP-dependent RNA helicase 52B [Platanthera zijinensis]|uniref:DEAD-box ATP-dependent RNA helicase 52B n=1 Tax=Platanthera zijinensis TaxID=2320716 RepID=A0AAP0GBB4_9ASPA
MRTSWADTVASESSGGGAISANSLPSRSSYVPPHLRNRPSNPQPPALSPARTPVDPPRPVAGGRWSGAVGRDNSRPGIGCGNEIGVGWNSRAGGWDRGRVREPNPFANDAAAAEVDFGGLENSGINFDAYEDIPVETSGDNVPPPVSTFSEIDLGPELNENIRRCKYVKPTPVQRHAIPISLAGRDLMACAQTGSGKTAAFCFPIISGILRGQSGQRQRGMRSAFPLALILSPTRELSVQIHEEARKFAFQTGVRVVVAYGGAPIHQQSTTMSMKSYLFERSNHCQSGNEIYSYAILENMWNTKQLQKVCYKNGLVLRYLGDREVDQKLLGSSDEKQCATALKKGLQRCAAAVGGGFLPPPTCQITVWRGGSKIGGMPLCCRSAKQALKPRQEKSLAAAARSRVLLSARSRSPANTLLSATLLSLHLPSTAAEGGVARQSAHGPIDALDVHFSGNRLIASVSPRAFSADEMMTLRRMMQGLSSEPTFGPSLSFAHSCSPSAHFAAVPFATHWIIDSGVTDHMTKASSSFVSYSPLSDRDKDLQTKKVIGSGRMRDGLYVFDVAVPQAFHAH